VQGLSILYFMPFSTKGLIRDITKVNESDILSCWLWKLDQDMKIVMISNFGDLFLESEEGSIYWLLTDGGELKKIANDRNEFEKLLSKKEYIDNWFLPALVEKLLSAEMELKENEVYGLKKMAVLGGTYDIHNFLPTDMSVHFAFTGQICEQIKDLPDGTNVNITFKPITHNKISNPSASLQNWNFSLTSLNRCLLN
jgi:hypothetical protein